MNIDAKIQHERDFIKYLRLLAKRKNHSIIFIAVGDTGAGPALTEDIVREFMACLGIKVSLLNRYRCAYASIIEKGTVIAEKLSSKVLSTKSSSVCLAGDLSVSSLRGRELSYTLTAQIMRPIIED